jgi:RND family efflux transporter MFP subunit
MRLKLLPRLSVLSPYARLASVGWLAVVAVSCRESETKSRPGAEAPRAVAIETAALRPMERTLAVTGTLAAQEQATLSVKVPGRLERIAIDLGSAVKRGDLIAQIEKRDYELRVQQARAALGEARAAVGLPLEGTNDDVELATVASVKQARAVLDEAEKNRERALRLAREGISSKSDLDTAETGHAVALTRHESAWEEARTRLAVLAQRRAELHVAEQQLRDTAVFAPFDGAIQSRLANPGEYLQVGAPLALLVQRDPLRLRLEVPERASPFVQMGQRVRIRVDGTTNSSLGQIARISPALTEQNRMLLVEADVPAGGILRPGLFVRAEIIVNEQESALTVPTNAVIVFAGIQKVVTVEDGKARERTVTTGRRHNGWIEITSGIQTGEPVVLAPGNLRTGQPVTTKADAASAQLTEAATP